MKKYSVVLFDLDGTLSDPKVGITKSVQYALQKIGIVEENLNKLETFIGPPLQVSFREIYGLDDVRIQQAIAYYRERFIQIGLYENNLYENIFSLLEYLQKEGYQLAIATSKPTVFAEQILQYFNIEHFFELVAGSNLDGTRSAKGEVITFAREHFNEANNDQFIMIGDRKYDIVGAHENQMDSIGVTYGYGSLDELTDAQATYIVENVNELQEFFNRLN
ncbi:5'-nucleotidase [Lysinibacillus sphaericus]|uniref:HAD family hydrolase n=1 Tax=Lysinibacillus sphaericus TaxID=1421 RepID=UPI0018CEE7F4|nr:HAD family hydrolase [Lysinibacillus sphaericus]MBG9456614.1 5'-nucleotidase [Lysinibacillus sphaericus]MBG9480014.1 5'-nucleotidase [Lysinibacillus sphaericus]MBG9594225.1 5'-nucleotidase [Lysinibacillus sphaericus]